MSTSHPPVPPRSMLNIPGFPANFTNIFSVSAPRGAHSVYISQCIILQFSAGQYSAFSITKKDNIEI